MRKPITIPCYFHTEETKELDKLELDYSSDMFAHKEVYFFNIDSVYEAIETSQGVDRPVTMIFSGGVSYESPLSVEDVLKIIADGEMGED